VVLGFLGLPSLHDIVEAVAGGFFTSLAGALVPGFLKHATVATIQHLVALPDPAAWGHVGRLQEEMVFLGAMLLPVTLAAGTLRYWLVGLTGNSHPTVAVTRCVWVTGVLVAYRWIVEQAVAAANTFTHAILAMPAVGDGLARLVTVLFGGALLTGSGGVFGALLVIVGVVFAAGLFAAQVLLTLALAVLVVAGPPLIAVSAIPELAHLASAWGRALLALTLVPLGWTLLFATAGALTLDATSFTGGANGLPGQVAAAFAALITFVLAVRLPWTMLGSLKRLLAPGGAAHSALSARSPATAGLARVSAAHTRLRAAGLEGAVSLGRSAGLAAGALGIPAGGLLGVARRRLEKRGAPANAAAAAGTPSATRDGGARAPSGVRERMGRAAAIVREAPGRAHSAAASASRRTAAAASDSRRPAQNRPTAITSRGGTGIETPGARETPKRGSGGSTHTTAHAARIHLEPPAASTAPSRSSGSSRQSSQAGPSAGRARAAEPGRPAPPAPARPQDRATPRAKPSVQAPHHEGNQPPPRPGGRRKETSGRPGQVPPGGRDPVRPTRPRKPDRRPRKGRGR